MEKRHKIEACGMGAGVDATSPIVHPVDFGISSVEEPSESRIVECDTTLPMVKADRVSGRDIDVSISLKNAGSGTRGG